MKTTTIITIVLGVLLLVSVVQAFQLNALKTEISEGGVKLSTSGSSTPSASSTSESSGSKTTGSLPSSIKNLPTVVGGC